MFVTFTYGMYPTYLIYRNRSPHVEKECRRSCRDGFLMLEERAVRKPIHERATERLCLRPSMILNPRYHRIGLAYALYGRGASLLLDKQAVLHVSQRAFSVGAVQLVTCMHHGEKIDKHTEHARYSVNITYGICRICSIYVYMKRTGAYIPLYVAMKSELQVAREGCVGVFFFVSPPGRGAGISDYPGKGAV